MTSKYNENALVFTMAIDDIEKFEKIMDAESIHRYLIKYTVDTDELNTHIIYGDLNSFFINEFVVGRGNIGDVRRQVIIGDRIAYDLYNTVHCLEKTFKKYGREYDIVGVIKNSSEIYINHDESINLDIKKTTVYIEPPKGQSPEFYKYEIKYRLLKEQLTYTQFKMNRWYSDTFMNLCLGLVLIILLYLLVWSYKEIKVNIYEIIALFREDRRQYLFIEFLERHVKKLLFIGCFLLAILMLSLFSWRVLGLFRISSYFLPVNFLSLKDYEILFKTIIEDWHYAYRSGLHDIEIKYIEGILLNFSLISITSLVYLIRQSFSRGENSK